MLYNFKSDSVTYTAWQHFIELHDTCFYIYIDLSTTPICPPILYRAYLTFPPFNICLYQLLPLL